MSKKTLISVAFLIVVTFGATSQAWAEPILGEEGLASPSLPTDRSGAGDATALFKARDYEGALKVWQEAAQSNVDMPPAQVILAYHYLQANMLEDAKTALQQATIDAPTDPEPYLVMAGLALRARDIESAESFCKKAGDLLPKFSKSPKRKTQLEQRLQSGRANLAESRGDWAKAQKLLEDWVKAEPKNAAALQRLARCLFQQKNVDGAIARLREAVKIEPSMMPPELIVAKFYHQAGDRENSKKWSDKALEASPDNLRLRVIMGRDALGSGDLDEARKHSIAATQIDPKSIEAKELRGSIAMLEKDYDSAELIFEAALKLQPDNFSLRNNLSLSLVEQKDETKRRRALEYTEANVKKYPNSPEAASSYALVLYRLGRLDDAEKAILKAAPLLGIDIDTAYVASRIAVDRGHKDQAKQWLETALKNKGPAMFRQDAVKLLEELKK